MFQFPSQTGLSERARRNIKIIAPYLAIIALAFAFNVYRLRAMSFETPAQSSYAEANRDAKPFFSLTTNRTYRTSERARLWVSYQGVDTLDFRVYQIKDPVKFFMGLDDPHQIGEEQRDEVGGDYQGRFSALEETRSLKSWIYKSIKEYVRAQLKREHRKTFNEKFRPSDTEQRRLPLNVADYARVPLLNPNQLVSSWRETLPPMQYEYDGRSVSLGKREPGVYLVEAVGGGDLRAYCVAVVTDLTMVQKTSRDGDVLVYVVDRASGAPRENASVEVVRNRETLAGGATDAGGIFKARIEKKAKDHPEDVDPEEGSGSKNSYLVMARDGNNFTISDLDSFYFNSYAGAETNDQSLTSYIYTDRPVYRPAQRVYFKGILRRQTENGYEMYGGESVNVMVEDNNNGKLSEQTLPLSPLGTFGGEVEIPDEAPLGSYHITAQIGGATASSYFSVEEYKKPEYKVKVTQNKQFATVGEQVRFTVDARYFFGAPVADASVQYYIYRACYHHYWWGESEDNDFDDSELEAGEDGYDGYDYGYGGGDTVDEGEGTLDARGGMTIEFEVPPAEEANEWDYTYRLEAHVTDASRREIQASASFVGTRGRTAAYVQPESYIYYRGDAARIKIRTADYAGHPKSSNVTLRFIEQRWERVERESENGYKYTDYVSRERELSTAEVETNNAGEAFYDYPVAATGSIYVKLILREDGKEIATRGGSFWATERNNGSGEQDDFSFRDYNEGTIKFIADKKFYRPGDTAHVLAVLPVESAHLLVTTERASVLTARRIEAKGRTVMIDVPIEARYEPNIYLSVAYVKGDELYTSERMLAVPARDKYLNVEIIPNKKEYKPRETAFYTVLVRNADGSPASGAEVSFGVVDEAIYSIMPESAGSIRRAFYGRRYNEVETHLATAFAFTGYSGTSPIQLARNRRAYQLADFKNDSEFAEPTVRREFKDTAFWRPDLVTDRSGKAVVNFNLPDNLTTWRATARAVTSDTRVGSAVQKVLARKNLIMRLQMPRFLTEGDTATISGVVHNFLKTDETTRISLEVNGAQLQGSSVETVKINRGGQRRVDWRISAPQAGEVRLLAKALTDAESDAVEMTFEVVPHGLRQAMGGVMTISEDAAERIVELNLPAHPDVQARRLRIEAAPSIAGTLFGALDYLTGYPYGCTEQTMSRFLPDVIVRQALRDVPTARIRATNDLDEKVGRGLDRLYSHQHADGGWGWWKADASDPFMTAYVVDGLTLAAGAGYEVDTERMRRGRARLMAMLDEKATGDGTPDGETRAYMVYALVESGEADSGYVDELYRSRANLQPYGRALLALALKIRGDERASEVAREIEASARASDFDAHWESRVKSHYGYEQTMDTEATAFSLKALAQINPQSALLPKAARWLVNVRRNGYYWASTRETAFAIFGLTEYLKTSQELQPDYMLEVYVGDERVISRRVTSEDAASGVAFIVERKGQGVGNTNRVRVVKRGRGVLYLSTALEYFTGEDEVAAQGSSELKLTREYLRLRVVENDNGKANWRLEPLAGEVRSGDLIVSRLRIEGARAQYMMVEDPIPAGCVQVARNTGINLNYTESNWSDWYSQREFRDERTVFFLDRFDGDAVFQYAMRVEVPGSFRVAPARAELMYQPTVQANTSNHRLNITDKR